VAGHISVRDSMKGTMGRVPLLGNLKNEVFERYAECPVNASLSIEALLGNLEGVHLVGLSRKKKSMSWFLSLSQRPLRF